MDKSFQNQIQMQMMEKPSNLKKTMKSIGQNCTTLHKIIGTEKWHRKVDICQFQFHLHAGQDNL